MDTEPSPDGAGVVAVASGAVDAAAVDAPVVACAAAGDDSGSDDGDGEAGTGAGGAAPVSDEDIAAAIRVLVAAAADSGLLASKRLRGIRKALHPLLALAQARMYDGDADAYRDRKRRKLANAVQRNLDKQRDREHINKTALRAARTAKLATLAAQDGGALVPLVLDGVGDASLAATGLLPRLGDWAGGGSAAGADGAAGVVGDSDTVGSSGAAEAAGSVADGGAVAGDGDGSAAAAPRLTAGQRACYICKCRFRDLHAFYDTLCPACADLNWRKRNQTADLTGRVALVTGARVKIGFHCALKLLRAGAEVVATTRFPADATERFAALADWGAWGHRLHVFGLDLRSMAAVEDFCAALLARLPRLDIVVNNACQTVRRPPAYFAATAAREADIARALPPGARAALAWNDALHAARGGGGAPTLALLPAAEASGGGVAGGGVVGPPPHTGAWAAAAPAAAFAAGSAPAVAAGVARGVDAAAAAAAAATAARAPPLSSAQLSQLSVAAGDEFADARLFPAGVVDVNAQQLDLRARNSWMLKLEEVGTPELAEVMLINAMAPFVLNSRLKPLMTRGRGPLPPGGGAAGSSPLLSVAQTLAAAAEARAGGGRNGGGQQEAGRRTRGGAAVLGEQAASVPADAARFIVNVSAMEGKFYRAKLSTHPHTNMAKAALNMMTRTSAGEWAAEYLFMNCADTGWINLEQPAATAERITGTGFQTPLDEVDAAARVLDPVFAPLAAAARGEGCRPVFGAFLKDYFASEW